eukprot:TRINITY_DN11619_c0_g3_i1.p3 TRINITY_DN11619_c0_g3~~TRINITY_DN11619_c0_g3_i1.p3  ORF type:complete len:133 (-),score=3.85 TRINITY_DN11619_c0_g3_i1:66-464(-)
MVASIGKLCLACLLELLDASVTAYDAVAEQRVESEDWMIYWRAPCRLLNYIGRGHNEIHIEDGAFVGRVSRPAKTHSLDICIGIRAYHQRGTRRANVGGWTFRFRYAFGVLYPFAWEVRAAHVALVLQGAQR